MDTIDKPKRKQLRLKAYDYSSNGACFITICANTHGHNVFSQIESNDSFPDPATVLTAAGKIVDGLIQNIDRVYPGVHVDTYCLMPDHIHLLLMIRAKEDGPPRAAAPAAIPTVINSLKSLATKRCGKVLWQRGYYEHVIRCETELNEIREYIENYPRKKILLERQEL